MALASMTVAAAAVEATTALPVVQEGHTYAVKDGKLVDTTETAPSPPPTPTPSPAQQPTIVINNNVVAQTQQPQVNPTPPPASAGNVAIPQTPNFRYGEDQYNFILSVIAAVNNHDWQALAPYVANGHLNYFGDRYSTINLVRREMIQDSYRYGAWHATYDPASFSREVSGEYSPHWEGPMIYDEINAYVEVDEPGVRVHRALQRFTVGYTNIGGVLRIYALVFRVL
jgi:hypothetical protein